MRLGEAAILAETVREQVAGQPFTAGGHALAVSISAGVALLMADAHSAYQTPTPRCIGPERRAQSGGSGALSGPAAYPGMLGTVDNTLLAW